MNEQFYELPQEKQLRIINAGVEVFSQHDYKHASTEEIARKAGISKGLLFYYFHNKKSLYLHLFYYCADLMINRIADEAFHEITDFFELIQYAAERKVAMLEQTPYLMDFVVSCFYEEEGAGPEVGETMGVFMKQGFTAYFEHVDYSKFRDSIDPRDIYDMLTWLTIGFLHDQRRAGKNVDLKETMDLFYKWKNMLKQIAYREEYQEKAREGGSVRKGNI